MFGWLFTKATPMKDDYPSASHSKWWPLDQRLRRRGYSIHSRPKDGEATWLGPNGGIWLESEALIQLEREEAEAETEGK